MPLWVPFVLESCTWSRGSRLHPPQKQPVPVGTERGYVTRDAEPSPQGSGLSFVHAPPVLFHTLLLAKNCIQCVFSLRSSSRRLVASHLVVAVKIGYIQQVARSFFLYKINQQRQSRGRERSPFVNAELRPLLSFHSKLPMSEPDNGGGNYKCCNRFI